MKKILLLIACILITNHLLADVAYVSARSGANVRSGPSSSAELIATLAFGDKVEIIEATNTTEIITLGNRKITSRWMKIALHDNEYYILEALLHTSIFKIPPHALYYYYQLSVYDHSDYGHITISYDNENPYTDTYDAYYEPNRSDFTITKYGNKAGESEYYNDRSRHIIDTLKKYFTLEIVDVNDYQNKKVKNPYEVNTKKIERVLTTHPDPYYSFSLPINKGKDSIIIKSGKYDDADHYHYTYAGRIPFINKYIIRGQYEEPKHDLYDMTTGKKVKAINSFTEGMPYISPDGKYVIDFYQTMGFSCMLAISTLDKDLHIKKRMSVEFKSWLPVEETNSAFWISDHELIIKVYAVMNVIKYDHKKKFTKYPESFQYQYIKLTIR